VKLLAHTIEHRHNLFALLQEQHVFVVVSLCCLWIIFWPGQSENVNALECCGTTFLPALTLFHKFGHARRVDAVESDEVRTGTGINERKLRPTMLLLSRRCEAAYMLKRSPMEGNIVSVTPTPRIQTATSNHSGMQRLRRLTCSLHPFCFSMHLWNLM
jgi:hypothetical protein